MLIDHIGAGLLEQILIHNGYGQVSFFNLNEVLGYGDYAFLSILFFICRIIGRIALPIFCFLLVEGFLHTKNEWKYVLRLLVFAFVSEIPFDLANSRNVFSIEQQNIFWGLSISVAVLACYRYIEKDKIVRGKLLSLYAYGGIMAAAILFIYLLKGAKWAGVSIFAINMYVTYIIAFCALFLSTMIYIIMSKRKGKEKTQILYSKLLFLVVGMMLTVVLRSDYSFGVVLSTTLIYAYRNKRLKGAICGILALIVADPFEIPGLLALIPILCYNGQRGMNLKYVFYIFYPAHLLIIALLCKLIVG